ncbi:hypothetical protein D3C85_826030 [compost metagenome]
MQMALTDEQRKQLLESLASGIDHSGLNLDEFIFASADLLKTHFWMNLTAGKDNEEVLEIRERILKGVQDVVGALENNTDSIAEDMIILFTVALEAVNHVFESAKQLQQNTEPAGI